MYPFVFLAPTLAFLVAQAPEPAGAADPPAAEEQAPAAMPQPQTKKPDGKAPGGGPGSETPAQPKGRADAERTQVARAALAFLDALVTGDAAGLAAASAERFSFDGDVRNGKEEIRRTWRGVLASREAAHEVVLLDLEILTAPEAISRLGPPPPRLAPLAGTRGAWVAIANLSRRPLVLFLVREGARWAVAGIE